MGDPMITITPEDLRALCPHAREEYVTWLVDHQDILADAGILENENRWTAFIANVAAETGGLRVREEVMGYTWKRMMQVWPTRFRNTPAGRAKAKSLHMKPRALANQVYGARLGNRGRNTNDGYDYRGRSFLQITGRTMYVKMGDLLGIPLEDEPRLVISDGAVAVRVAALTWTQYHGDLNEWADRGQFRATCNGINRGNPRSRYNPIGWTHRQRYYAKARRIFAGAKRPASDGTLREGVRNRNAVRDLQKRLRALGYHSVGVVDGDFGDNTATGLMNFQRVNALRVTGVYDAATRKVLEGPAALPKPVSAHRETATGDDLAGKSSTVDTARTGKKVTGWTAVGGGVVGIGTAVAEALGTVQTTVEPVQQTLDWGMGTYGALFALVVAAVVAWQVFQWIERSRVAEHRDGRNMGAINVDADPVDSSMDHVLDERETSPDFEMADLSELAPA